MSVAASSQPQGEIVPSAARARRWMQFRLGTLFLLPVLLALMQKLAVNDVGSLALLGLMLGGVFGSLWALGRMRIVGLSQTGLRRLGPVLLAATSGGLTAGMVAGPVALWIAMYRRNPEWFYVLSPTAQRMVIDPTIAISEFVLSGLYGCSVGAVFGAWGALIVGPLWAYVAFARRWSQSLSEPNGSVARAVESTYMVIRRRQLARYLVVALYLVGLLGFPSYAALHRWYRYRDEFLLAEINQSGLRTSATDFDLGPNFLQQDNEFVAPRVRKCFHGIRRFIVAGKINDASLAALACLPDTKKVAFKDLESSPDDQQLLRLVDTMVRFQAKSGHNRFPYLSQTRLLLRGNQFTPAGLKQALDGPVPYRIEFIDAPLAAATLRGLQSKSGFAAAAQSSVFLGSQTFMVFVTRYRASEITYALPRQPPPMVPLFFRWPFY